MKSSYATLIDLSLTHAIEGYRAMEADEACQAITREWPSQIALLIAVFLFNSTCKNCSQQAELRHFNRSEGLSHFVALVCPCKQGRVS